ncbi:MCP four helix bundle domain-containing protein [Rufibacter sediminis]|uniref:MCP four helix bundle domain-containing protein n=1 Tax=Rufibacter sediminis TaxID=2762756 RepID=A0ABR6VR68_9BACT|nr:MCP four helix bundle domain-containing protein [Rufibacter sediminis]MBC3539076.1 MCP four helix bundle domain-containing protein [Rufibacter sediminis]
MKHKTRAALLLAAVMLLVLAKNTLDSNTVTKLGTSFTSVYEDRLLVESYIYQLSGHLYQKKMLMDNAFYAGTDGLLSAKLSKTNSAISTLLTDYAKTELTADEARYLRAFQQNHLALQTLENQYLRHLTGSREMVGEKQQMDAQFQEATGYLNQLSHIQVAEGKRLNDSSKQMMAGSALLTQVELVLIVVIGVMIQMLVFASKSKFSKFPQNPMLN